MEQLAFHGKDTEHRRIGQVFHRIQLDKTYSRSVNDMKRKVFYRSRSEELQSRASFEREFHHRVEPFEYHVTKWQL